MTKNKFRKFICKQTKSEKKERKFKKSCSLKMWRSLISSSGVMTRSLCKRLCSTETLKPTFESTSFDSLPNNESSSNQSTDSTSEGFETLLRKSAFIQMGDPVGKVILVFNANSYLDHHCSYSFSKWLEKYITLLMTIFT